MTRLARAALALIAICAVVAAPGCARPKAWSGPEPRTIVLRNATGQDFRSIVVREHVVQYRRNPARGADPAPQGPKPARVGMISPLYAGSESDIVRRDGAEPLPLDVILEWVGPSGATSSALLDLEPVLREATGAAGEELVFEVSGRGDARAYVRR